MSVIREVPQEDDAGGDTVDVSASPEKSEEAIPEEGKWIFMSCFLYECLFLVVYCILLCKMF